MINFEGLTGCNLDIMSSSPACIQKSVEISITLILLISIIIILCMRINYQRQINLYVIINLLMILSLTFNAFYDLFRIKELNYLQNVFFNSYFPTLVYKFAIKLFQKDKENIKKLTKAVKIIYAVYLMLVLGVFIYSNVLIDNYCQQIPYLLINFLGVTLSIWLVIFGIKLDRAQQKRNQSALSVEIYQPEKMYNPMPWMWRCIIINIISQTVALGTTIYFISDPEMNCKFSHNQKIEYFLQFIFLVATYYVGMIATLMFFHQKGKSYLHWHRTNLRKSSDQGKVELIDVTNFQANQKVIIV